MRVQQGLWLDRLRNLTAQRQRVFLVVIRKLQSTRTHPPTRCKRVGAGQPKTLPLRIITTAVVVDPHGGGEVPSIGLQVAHPADDEISVTIEVMPGLLNTNRPGETFGEVHGPEVPSGELQVTQGLHVVIEHRQIAETAADAIATLEAVADFATIEDAELGHVVLQEPTHLPTQRLESGAAMRVAEFVDAKVRAVVIGRLRQHIELA